MIFNDDFFNVLKFVTWFNILDSDRLNFLHIKNAPNIEIFDNIDNNTGTNCYFYQTITWEKNLFRPIYNISNKRST